MMKTILITNNKSIAVDAQAAGVSRIMVDLESHGKKERQASRATVISTHSILDVAAMRRVVTSAELMVRVNGWHPGSPQEIHQVIEGGADRVMLPMITALSQWEAFVATVAGRAKIIPLVETAYSMAHIEEIAAHPSVDEVYIGLNDLHLSLGLDFLFEPLALGLIDWMAERIRLHRKSFGFGGIGAIGGAGELSPHAILGEHARLGSSCVILSSRFAKDIDIAAPQGRPDRLRKALSDIQRDYEALCLRAPTQQAHEHSATQKIISQLTRQKW